MNRRCFLRLTAAALLTPPLWIMRRRAVRVYVEAERARHRTGPIKKTDIAAIRKPGRWAG